MADMNIGEHHNPVVETEKDPSTSSGGDASVPAAKKKCILWKDNIDFSDRLVTLGCELAAQGDLFRNAGPEGGLLLVMRDPAVLPRVITDGRALSAIIVDRFQVRELDKKSDYIAGRIPVAILSLALTSEVFLGQFKAVDQVTRTPLYLPDFTLTVPGYNDGGPGHRVLFIGDAPAIESELTAVTAFLDVMEFATPSDRTNAIAAALTVMLCNHFYGGKPLLAVTASKSHAGKDTVILFAVGGKRLSAISYQATDWALERSFVGALKQSPDTTVVCVENARLASTQRAIASAFLERFVTDPEPFLFSTGTGNGVRPKNRFVVAISTNYGMLSEDLLNRSLPIHLEPKGDVNNRVSPIGNPKIEYLPANRARIEAELRGMIAKWTEEGKPSDDQVRHPFGPWAETIGGILKVNGFTDFLSNYKSCKTALDPCRRGLGLLGAQLSNEWRPVAEFVKAADDLGVTKDVISGSDRGSAKALERGMGVTLSAHINETFHALTDSERLDLRLEKARRRFDGGEPATRYRFVVERREPLPVDDEEAGDRPS